MNKFNPLDADDIKSLEDLEAAMRLEEFKTELRKTQFINDMKNGLGQEVKKNPRKVKVIEKTKMQKVGIFLKKIFTKF